MAAESSQTAREEQKDTGKAMGPEETQISKPSREELYFGVEPTRFIDDTCIVIEDYISDAVDWVEKTLKKEIAGEGIDEAKVKSCSDKLHGAFKNLCDENFDKFEVYLKRNILIIPDDVNVACTPVQEAGSVPASSPSQGEDDEIVKQLAVEESQLDEELATVEAEIAAIVGENAKLRVHQAEMERRLEIGRGNLDTLSGLGLEQISPELVEGALKRSRDLQQAIRDGGKMFKSLSNPSSGCETPAARRKLERQLRVAGDSKLSSLKKLKARLFGSDEGLE
mmetsp:Transcript_1373/g.2698  ORF Transcript_1373/g.2698 Transcript_1373/m.2698 type:complete len:281 (+) Transcript_1373:203-1045(+)